MVTYPEMNKKIVGLLKIDKQFRSRRKMKRRDY